MYKVAAIAGKGGPGKTTLSLSLAVAAERAGLSTVIIDLDAIQTTACKWSDRREAETPIIIDAQPGRLLTTLEKAEQGGVDIVIIDTPPLFGNAALTAAKAADLILIPCKPQIFDIETMPDMKQLLDLAGDKPTLAILNAIKSKGTRHVQAKAALENFGIPVCPITIGDRVAFGDAALLGQSVIEYEPNGKAATEILDTFKYILSIVTFQISGEVCNAESESRLTDSVS